ncbi:MAG: phosphoglycerate kinase [Flavobacteriaceae bacterium]
MKTINKFDFNNKKAIVRVDFNVPIEKEKVTDNSRILAAKTTIDKIISDGGSCILMSHLGRPKGFDNNLSMSKIHSEVERVLNTKVILSKDVIGDDAINKAINLSSGEILLLENLRFHKEETDGDVGFAKKLSTLADCYVNDAFGTAHRAHASTTIIARYFDNKFFGSLLEKEVKSIEKVMQSGEKPVLAILGGAKISSKIPIINNIIDVVDHIIIGGGMSFTFIKALGGKIGSSICEDEMISTALEILARAKEKNVKIHLPSDVVCAKEFSNDAETKNFDIYNIPDDYEGMDAGKNSIEAFRKVVLDSKTILWNGPVGVFEFSNFSKGTKELGNLVAESTANGAFSLVGGGDSVAAVKKFGLQDKVSYVSTGGGAMLESLEGKTLPGISALSN